MRATGVMDFAGGFACGVTQAGFDYVAKREPSAFGGFGVTAVERNLQGVQIEVTEPEFWSVVKSDLLFGCPPCSGFSMLSAINTADSKTGKVLADGTRVSQRGVDSPDNDWMYHLIDYASKVKPEIVVFESVRGGGTLGAPLMRELWGRLRDQTGVDYHMTDVFMNAASVGGDVKRSRYFFVAHRRPFGVDLPKGTPRPLMDVIGDLGPDHGTRLDAGVDLDWGHVTNGSRSDQRIRQTIELFRSEGYDWAQGRRLPEHFKVWLETHDDYPDFWYGSSGKVMSHAISDNLYSPFRWRANDAMGVVTGGFMDRAIHPLEPRTFTYREGARFMGLPDSWSLWPIVAQKHDNWLGKAIPVASGRWIATWARGSMEGAPGEYAGELVEEKHRVIDVSTPKQVHDIERQGGAGVWWPDPVDRPRTIYLPAPVGRGEGRPESTPSSFVDEPVRRRAAAPASATQAAPRTPREARAPRERVVAGPITRVAPSVVAELLEQLALTRADAADALGVSRSRIAELVSDRKPGSWLNAERWDETARKLAAFSESRPRTM